MTEVALGARRTVPLLLGTLGSGLVMGVLARGVGLGPGEAGLMSAVVFSGTAQFAVVAMLPVAPPSLLVLTASLVNARYVLMGASLRPRLGSVSRPAAYGSLFLLTDESWALSVAEGAAGPALARFLVGSGLAQYACWVGGTLAGWTLPLEATDPARWGLDVVAGVALVALLAALRPGRRDVLPWATAGAVAAAAGAVFPPPWPVLVGAAVGATVGARGHGP